MVNMLFDALSDSYARLTGEEYITSEQHKETTAVRIRRDMDDTTKLIEFLEKRNPFAESLELRNIATGVRSMSGPC